MAPPVVHIIPDDALPSNTKGSSSEKDDQNATGKESFTHYNSPQQHVDNNGQNHRSHSMHSFTYPKTVQGMAMTSSSIRYNQLQRFVPMQPVASSNYVREARTWFLPNRMNHEYERMHGSRNFNAVHAQQQQLFYNQTSQNRVQEQQQQHYYENSSLPVSPENQHFLYCNRVAQCVSKSVVSTIGCVSNVIKTEAITLKKRMLYVQECSGNVKRRKRATNTDLEDEMNQSLPNANEEVKSLQADHEKEEEEEDDDCRGTCLGQVEENEGIQKQALRIKRLSHLLQQLDTIHTTLIEELKNSALETQIIAKQASNKKQELQQLQEKINEKC